MRPYVSSVRLGWSSCIPASVVKGWTGTAGDSYGQLMRVIVIVSLAVVVEHEWGGGGGGGR